MTRVAVVTGAARGIGAATCRALADAGTAVVALDRATDDPALPYPLGTVDELAAVVADCRGRGVHAVDVAGDTRDEDALQAAVDAAEQLGGGLDVVVAAAGVVGGGGPAWEVDRAVHAAVLGTNLTGVLTATRVLVPALLARPAPRDGRFLAVGSVAATTGLPGLASYCASKAGVLGLVRALAVELAGTGVTAATVSPGSTDTRVLEASAALYDLPDASAFADQATIGRLLSPDEVAATIAFLAGPGGAGITGTDVVVDGGLSL